MDIKEDEFLQQFKGKNQGRKWAIEYSLQDRKFFLTKIILPEGETIENEETKDFVASVLEVIRERKYKVLPSCAELKDFFKQNKSFYDLLPAGIRM